MKMKGVSFILFGCFAGVLLPAQQAPDRPRRIVPAPSTATGASSYTEPLAEKFYKRLMHATKRYKLSTTQQAQVQLILQREQEDDQVVTGDKLMSDKDKRKEQATLFEESQRQIGAILKAAKTQVRCR